MITLLIGRETSLNANPKDPRTRKPAKDIVAVFLRTLMDGSWHAFKTREHSAENCFAGFATRSTTSILMGVFFI